MAPHPQEQGDSEEFVEEFVEELDEAGVEASEPAPLAQVLKNRAVIVQVGKTEIADRAAQTGHDAGRPTQDTYCPSQKAI